MAYEFLPQLRNIHSTKRHTARTIVDDDFLFVITKVSNGPTLKTVNKALKPIEPDYHFFSGEKAQLLRSLDKIREERHLKSRGMTTARIYASTNIHTCYICS